MKCKIFMGLAWTFLLNVCLPTVDVISDVYFTWDVNSRDQMNYFITSGDLLNVCKRPDLRWKPREYLAAIFNQVMVPYLGLQTIRYPDDKMIQEQYWRLQAEEVYYESYLQASLQIFILVNDGVPTGSPSWIPSTIGNNDISLNAVLRIISVVISCVSLFYGLSKMELGSWSKRKPETCFIIKIFFTELPRKMALFIRVLICFSLYYVDENLFTCAIIYTCLDFVPIFVNMFWLKNYDLKDTVSFFIQVFEIKFILDPSRFRFKLSEGQYDSEKWSVIVVFNSIFTMWYTLLGIIFSSIFITFDFSCNESCDEFDRITRFRVFFLFSLVINVLALIYSLTSCLFAAAGKPLFPEEQKVEEETNV